MHLTCICQVRVLDMDTFKEDEESKQHRINLLITLLNNDLLIALTYKSGANLHS